MDVSWPALIAGLLGILVTAAFSYATQRSASRAAERSTSMSSRTDMEKDAFTRAEDYYQGVIADQDRRDTGRVADLDRCQESNRRLRVRVNVLQEENENLGNELGRCKEAVRSLTRKNS
jgi:hypothetical protein